MNVRSSGNDDDGSFVANFEKEMGIVVQLREEAALMSPPAAKRSGREAV